MILFWTSLARDLLRSRKLSFLDESSFLEESSFFEELSLRESSCLESLRPREADRFLRRSEAGERFLEEFLLRFSERDRDREREWDGDLEELLST